MEYQVKLTDYAVEQMQDIVRYISKILQSPDTAYRWIEKIKLEISSLRTTPNRYPLTLEELWHSEGIHKIPVENLLMYYWINDSQKIVWITVVVYERWNLSRHFWICQRIYFNQSALIFV